ncbi:MAG: Ig-like domain-containing protein [Prevotella sp.]|nr:Ig-like domain-containing protein [Prevotella sp.]
MKEKLVNMKKMSTMKTIKLLGIGMLMLMMCISVGSCGGDEYSTRIHELLIQKDITFESDEESGGSLTSVMTLRDEDLSYYRVSSDQEWCKATIDVKASTITISVKENNTFDDRKAVITLSDAIDGVSSRSINVTQKQNDVVRLDDESNEYEVKSSGGQVVINVESNVNYSVQIPADVDWITVPGSNGTRGLVKSQVILEVAKNTTEKARSAQISIKDESSGAQTLVLIQQEFKAFLRVKENSFTFDEHGGEVSIYIITNVSFDFYTDYEDDWIKKKGGYEVIDDSTVCQKITIAPFTDKEPMRTSTVSIQNKSFDKLEECEVDIIQTKDLFIIEESIQMMRGGSQNLTLYNATEEGVVWKSQDERVAEVDKKGNVFGISGGSTMITVTSADGLHTDQVTVTVENPEDLNELIVSEWQPTFTPYDGISVLTHLDCTITNNSDYDLVVNMVTPYCDSTKMTALPHDEILAAGEGMLFKLDIPAEKTADIVKVDTTYTEDSTMVISKETIPGKYKENLHTYTIVFDYYYSIDKDRESFTYQCKYSDNPFATTRKNAARRGRRK